MNRTLPLLCLILTHTLVDAFAIFIDPLWPRLSSELRLSSQQLFILMTLWALTPSMSQIGFGYLRDRYGARLLVLVGPVLAAACLALIGLAPSAPALMVVLLFGGVGVGAFHPEGAVAAGGFAPERRTRNLALFMFGGTCGLTLGPIISGNLVYAYGLAALAWTAVPGVAMVLVLAIVARRAGGLVHDKTDATARRSAPPTLGEIFDGRGRHAALLLAVCALRIVPSVGMGRALAFVLADRGFGENVIGNTISVFLLAGGAGMLVTAAVLRNGWERNAMIVCPLLGIPFLAAMSWPGCPYWVMVALLVPAGIVLTGTTPAMVSYAHQLLPRGQGLASSLTMGVSWGLGGTIVSGLIIYYEQLGAPHLTLAAFTPWMFLSAVGAMFLPQVAKRERLVPAAEAS